LTAPNPVPLMMAPFQLNQLDQVEGTTELGPPAPPEAAPEATPAPEPAAAAEPESNGRGRHAATSPRKHRTWLRIVLALLLVAILAAAGGFVTARLRVPAAAATVTSTLAPTVTISSPPVTLPWAAMGQSAISVPSLGVAESSSNEVPVPVASLTKLMTAYVILRDHPLAAGQSGPNITMTPADVADYEADTTQDQANAAITVGEVLTELQLLEGTLVHSANDFADALATWDAGTLPAFVAKMNQAAAQLGMTHTTFADASGYSAASQSTASDILIVAAKDMEDPTLASIVRMPSVTLPVAGTVATYTPLLGFLGTVGVKSGFTSQAGGCDVLAVARVVHGQKVLILAAVTGQTGVNQPNVLLAAGGAALTLADAVDTSLGSQPVVPAGSAVARVSAAGHSVDAVAQPTTEVLTWPGLSYHRVLVRSHAVTAGDAAGTRVGSVVVTLANRHIVVPVRLAQDLPKETLFQRLF
jgi:D-alanyl-D-alanine carboxypeptidase (penicillin-binding protein 5/6)